MVARRKFITLAGGAAAAWPLSAHAQQAAIPVIGSLSAVSPEGWTERLRGFRQGLKEVGFVDGENVAIDYRWAENRLEQLPALASDLVRKRVAVAFAHGGTAPAIAAKAATATVPVVFLVPDDTMLFSRHTRAPRAHWAKSPDSKDRPGLKFANGVRTADAASQVGHPAFKAFWAESTVM